MTASPNTQFVSKRVFGQLSDGREVDAWTLQGRGGLQLEVLTYGGVVRSLLVPRLGLAPVDVVLGFPTLENYLADTAYFGATVGRIAGRVAHGKLRVGDREYTLACNHGGHHLHGGDAFNTRLWNAEVVERSDSAPSIRLSLTSPAGDQGYPGEVSVQVTYTVTDDNSFLFETEARACEPTPVSLTHHSYFNLEGQNSQSVAEHAMQIFSDHFVPTDENMILSGQLALVDNTPGDLRQPRRLGEVIPHLPQCHGELYWLGGDHDLKPAARVAEPSTGLVLEVATTNSCLQTYFAESFDGSRLGKSGQPLQQFGGFCLECQGYPEAGRHPHLGDILVQPGTPQRHLTRYHFLHTSSSTSN